MSDLVGNPEDRFSRVEAHVIVFFVLVMTDAQFSFSYLLFGVGLLL